MSKRDRTVLIVVGVLACLGAYWMLLLSPKRAEIKTVGADIARAEQKLAESVATLSAGTAAKRDYARNYAMVAKLGQAVPADDGTTSLVYQLDTAAGALGVDFRTVKLTGGSAAAAPAVSPPAPPAPPAEGDSTEPASAAPAAPVQAATATLPPGASVGPAGFPTMPFALTFDGDFFKLDRYFASLQKLVETDGRAIRVGGRLLAIDGISLTAGRKGFPSVKAAVAATAYLLPPDQGLTGDAAATDPAAAGAAPTDPAAPGTTPAAPALVTPPAIR